jgi:hypothetical protein
MAFILAYMTQISCHLIVYVRIIKKSFNHKGLQSRTIRNLAGADLQSVPALELLLARITTDRRELAEGKSAPAENQRQLTALAHYWHVLQICAS